MKADQYGPSVANVDVEPGLTDMMTTGFLGITEIQTECSVMISTTRLSTDIIDDRVIYNFYLRTMDDDEKGHFSKRVQVCPVDQWALVMTFAQRKEQMVLVIDANFGKQNRFLKTRNILLTDRLLDRLMAILFERYRLFKADKDCGMFILAAGELSRFSCRMEAHVLELAHARKMDPEFLDWIENANRFSALTNYLS